MTDVLDEHQDPNGENLAVRDESDDPETLIGDTAPDVLETP